MTEKSLGQIDRLHSAAHTVSQLEALAAFINSCRVDSGLEPINFTPDLSEDDDG